MADEKTEIQELIETMQANTMATSEFARCMTEVNTKLALILTELQGGIKTRERVYFGLICFLIVAVVGFAGYKLSMPSI